MQFKTLTRQVVGAALFVSGVRRRVEPRSLTVLMYHAVTAASVEDAGQMSVSIERFEEHLSVIASTGAQVVDLVEGVRDLQAGTSDQPAVAIVFDDGFVGVHDHAAAALTARGWPATVFVTTSWIGLPDMPLAEPRLGRPMTWSELEAIRAAGLTIGSHTHTHPYLNRLDEAHARQELQESRGRLADRFGRPPDAFAYPFGAFGSFDARTRRMLVDEGFRVGCTTVFGRNSHSADPFELRRSRVSWCDDAREIAKILAGAYDWYAAVQRTQTRSPWSGTQDPASVRGFASARRLYRR